jgi:hypothetical protein
VITFPHFVEAQKEKSDMFLFVKYFCPLLYNKYVKVQAAATDDSQL